MTAAMGGPPEVPILLLGDAGVGKSTFLAYVPIVNPYCSSYTP